MGGMGARGRARVVTIGGGTGLPLVLKGLKRYFRRRLADLTAVVTVADDGGSSGRLRDEFHIPPPGDIRNCLVALADAGPLMERLLQHRFGGDGSLSGHNFGNLFLTALTHITGDFLRALQVSSKVLAVRGTILPSTVESVRLWAELSDGTMVKGETQISQSKVRIRRVILEPKDAPALPEVLEAIDRADAVFLGPGSLYTSVIPNLLVSGVADALRASGAMKVYIANLMTQPGETDGYSLSDHVAAILDHAGLGSIDGVLVNSRRPGEGVLRRYREAGAEMVAGDREKVLTQGLWVVEEDLIAPMEVARHHSTKVGDALIRLLDGGRGG